MEKRLRHERSARNHRATDRGAAMVEFGLLMPVIVLLLLAFVEFGMAFYGKSAMSAGVREAAREYARSGDYASVSSLVQSSTMGSGFLPASKDISLSTCDASNNCSGPYKLDALQLGTSSLSLTCPTTASYFVLSLDYPWNGISGGLISRLIAVASGGSGTSGPIHISASTRMHCTPY